MTNQEFISSVKEVENTTQHHDLLVELTKTNPNRLFEILNLIPKDQEYLLRNWQLRSVYERIIKIAGFELGLENIDIINKIFNSTFRERDKNLIASVLAFKKEPFELLAQQIQTNNDGLTELVIHELLSRNIQISKSKSFNKIKEINSKSQFSNLALETSELEKENDFPSYTSNGGGNGIAFGFQRNEEYKNIVNQRSEEIDIEQSNEIVHAIEHWGGMSIGYNGKYQSLLSVEKIIVSTPEFYGVNKIRIRELKPSKSFALIFNASSNGSAYTTGYYGAHGRLRTWKTINSMISNSKFISSKETENKIMENKWYEFNTDNWFINEWLDLGIITINEKSKEFGIIAATDTD